MAFELPPLPYAKNALEPQISAETLEYHYGKHHQAYVNTLNSLVEGTDKANVSLEKIIQSAEGKLFNQAAQVWNHSFYWNCMSPSGGGKPSGTLGDAIDRRFGSFDDFREEFTQTAIGQFGSGWGWLVKTADGQLEVLSTANAGNPITDRKTPLLTCDVWEHAYYIDYRNARPKYLEAWWDLVNWDYVEEQFERA